MSICVEILICLFPSPPCVGNGELGLTDPIDDLPAVGAHRKTSQAATDIVLSPHLCLVVKMLERLALRANGRQTKNGNLAVKSYHPTISSQQIVPFYIKQHA